MIPSSRVGSKTAVASESAPREVRGQPSRCWTLRSVLACLYVHFHHPFQRWC